MKEDRGAKRTWLLLLLLFALALGFLIYLMSGAALNTPASRQAPVAGGATGASLNR